jgi:hypothetical protein
MKCNIIGVKKILNLSEVLRSIGTQPDFTIRRGLGVGIIESNIRNVIDGGGYLTPLR